MACVLLFAPCCLAANAAPSLTDLSLEELSNLEVTSVSKSAERLLGAPAAIFVITHDDILRSGVTSIAEALRLAPNLQITQFSSTRYVAGARGFAGAEDAQNFSNKLLILIDGRSVYTPLYSGVYLDVQDVLMDDIDRIEVISGPGATLWGANAMNGVINIITRPASLTREPLVSAGVGTDERTVGARYGDKLGNSASYRVYAKAFKRDAMKLANGASAQDDWDKTQSGFRLDWSGVADSVTTQGDLYQANEGQVGTADGKVRGGNILGRWLHRAGASEWQLQGYYDYTNRAEPSGGAGFTLHTFDVDLQQRLPIGPNRVIWGGGARLHRYDITGTDSLLFDPASRALTLANLFAQDTIALSESVDATIGLKLERDPYSGWTLLPDARVGWQMNQTQAFWLAGSRAIRSPTPFDRDVVEKLDGNVFLTGNPSFKSEKVDAFEIGWRAQPWTRLSLSASVFLNLYDDLRTIEQHSATEFLPLKWGNLMKGDTYGVEAWAKLQLTRWWRLSPGLRKLQKDLKFKHGASGLVGISQSGDDPEFQALLTSSMDLGPKVTFDATYRHVGALPDPHLDPYDQLSASLDWRLSGRVDLSVTGFNLLKAHHLEYPAPSGESISRSVIAQVRCRFD